MDAVITSLLAGGHALLEGVPGLGKTLLVRENAATLAWPRGDVTEAQSTVQQPRRSLMPDQTREVLRKVADNLRRAGGIEAPAAAPPRGRSRPASPRA